MRQLLTLFLILNIAAATCFAAAPPAPPELPADVKGKDGVKAYLLKVLDSCTQAAAEFKKLSAAYAQLINAHGGDYAAAAKARPEDFGTLIRQMREAYQRLDSFGYEYVEGIVAGVPSLAKYDVELDSGNPAKGAAPDDPVADVVVSAGDMKIDHEGALNNFLIEPAVYGTNPRFVAATITLPGFEQPVAVPKAQVVVGLADYAVDGYARLVKDSWAWQPTSQDCFEALVAMTPTLADYFEEWKESKKAGGSDGRFVAVSRVSDMRGIMGSVKLIWSGLEEEVAPRDKELAAAITKGYAQIMAFIDDVQARENKAPLNGEAIDFLGSQAKEKADQLTAQTAQAAALLKIDVGAK